MNSFHLISTTPAVWSGDPLTTVEFRVTLPSNLGVVKSANAVLVLLSSNNQRSERSDDSIRRAKMEAGKQMRMPIDTFEYDHASPPVLIFQNQRISGPFVKSTTNAEQLLCSYLNSSEEYDGGHCLLKTRIDLNNLSTQITGFALQLEFSEQQIMTLDNRHLKPLARSFQERSNVINITKLKLCIQNITASVSVQEQEDKSEMVEWYSKHGGDNTSIDIMIHIKDEEGRIVNDYPKKLPLKAELVYEDGTAVLPLPDSIKKFIPKGQVYRAMRPEPCLGEGIGSCHFAFRIESVIQNHKPHRGFRLKVYPSILSGSTDVAGGLMEEIIVVKSRPSDINKMKKNNMFVGGRSTILQRAMGGIPVIVTNANTNTNTKTKSETARNTRRKANVCSDKKFDPTALRVRVEPETKFKVDEESRSILFDASCMSLFFTGRGDTCLACSESLSAEQGLNPADHKADCSLFLVLGPILTKYSLEGSGGDHEIVKCDADRVKKIYTL